MESTSAHEIINLAEFLSVCIYLAEESGKIIREVHESGKLKTKYKDEKFDPVTIADFKVQKAIIHNLNHLYPTLAIVGEEDPSSYDHLESSIDVDDIDTQIKQMIDENLLKECFEKRKELLLKSQYSDLISENPFEFSTANAELWLDPLDGTRDFVDGRVENVCWMLGIAFNQNSKIAILHKPFYNDDTSLGITYFGSLEVGAFWTKYDSKWSKEDLATREIEYLPPFENAEIEDEDTFEPKFAFTWNRFSKQMEEMVQNLEPWTYIKEGGAGSKAISVVNGNVDAFVYPNTGMSGWDSCGPEALLKARLGCVTDIYSDKFQYHKDMGKIKGCIYTKTDPIYNIVTKRLSKFVATLKAAI